MSDVEVEPHVEAMAKELWEAHATHHQAVIPMASLHWDEVDPFTREHWLLLGRTALAFRPK